MLKKEEGEEIKMRHDEREKIFCKPQVVIGCIVWIVVLTFSSLCGSLYLS